MTKRAALQKKATAGQLFFQDPLSSTLCINHVFNTRAAFWVFCVPEYTPLWPPAALCQAVMRDEHIPLAKRTAPDIALAMSYLNAHELSSPSERYVYILWILVAVLAVLLGLEYILCLTQRTILGVIWSKWATMQYNPRHVHRLAFVNLQLRRVVFVLLLLLPLLLLTFIGPDYVDPSVALFDMNYRAPTSPSQVPTLKRRDIQWGLGQYPRIMTKKPTYTLPYHTFWTMGSRFGDFCNALTPLIILFALKQAPCALFALPVFGHMASNALQYLHKWGGYLLWIYAVVHTLLWIVQVAYDARVQPDLWTHLLGLPRFRWAIVAFIFLTLLVVLSFPPIRRHYYEFFYVTHVICVIGFMIATWAHHPQLGGWMLAGFLVWGLERVWRAFRTLHFNYSERPADLKRSMHLHEQSIKEPTTKGVLVTPKGEVPEDTESIVSLYMASTTSLTSKSIETFRSPIPFDLQEELYPGFAFIQPLAGQMLRIVLRTSKPMSWSPGQWVYVGFPALSWIQTHPFTIACSYVDEFEQLYESHDSASQARRDAHLLVLLVRARNGLTRRLWDHVTKRCEMHAPESATSTDTVFPPIQGTSFRTQVQGIYMRTIVDGPFGGSARIDWSAYATCVVVCGGCGVTLGLSVLEYLCAKVALAQMGCNVQGSWGRPFRMHRIRFVWIMRDYAHLQWAASALRRCLEILPPEHLTIEMYATRVHYAMSQPHHDASKYEEQEDMYRPPLPQKLLHDMGLRAADLTQFEDGEEKPPNAMEQSMSEHIRVQGKCRRARTRLNRARSATHDRHAPTPLPVQHANRQADNELEFIQNGRMPPSALHVDTCDHYSDTSLNAYPLKPIPPPFMNASSHDIKTPRSMSPPPVSANLDPLEQQDFSVLSELTRPGYPDLSGILHEEVRQSQGRTLTVGCGPSGLMALLRTAVSDHTSIRKVWQGDASGHVSLFTESYEI